jgi:hypothetical protein
MFRARGAYSADGRPGLRRRCRMWSTRTTSPSNREQDSIDVRFAAVQELPHFEIR